MAASYNNVIHKDGAFLSWNSPTDAYVNQSLYILKQICIIGNSICVSQTTQVPLKAHSSSKDNKEIIPEFNPIFHTVLHCQGQRPRALLWANHPFLVNQISSLTYHFLLSSRMRLETIGLSKSHQRKSTAGSDPHITHSTAVTPLPGLASFLP